MTLEPFKYVIQAVAIEKDESGQVIREIPAEPAMAYSLDQAVKVIQTFEENLAAAQNGSGSGIVVPPKPDILVP